MQLEAGTAGERPGNDTPFRMHFNENLVEWHAHTLEGLIWSTTSLPCFVLLLVTDRSSTVIQSYAEGE